MNEAEATSRPEASAADLGVVEPLRIPGLTRARAAWRRLPITGQAFVALALADLVARALGLGGLTLFLDLAYPSTFVFFALPHYALVLLPVVILARRPDAADGTPLVLRGAVALALVELLSEPLLSVVFPASGPDLTGWTLLQAVAVMARAGGFVVLGMGILALATFEPGPGLRGLANLVGGILAVTSITSVLLALLFPPSDFGFPGMGTQLLAVGVLQELAALGFAFLAWAVVRGTVDIRRPIEATVLATGAVVVGTANAFLLLATNVAALVQLGLGGPVGGFGSGFTLGFIGTGFVVTLLVVAFGLGLGDTSVRIPRGGGAPLPPSPEPEPVRWPAPGGDVPAFRVPRPADERQSAGKGRGKSRRRQKESRG